jgi:hypothetical protein
MKVVLWINQFECLRKVAKFGCGGVQLSWEKKHGTIDGWVEESSPFFLSNKDIEILSNGKT